MIGTSLVVWHAKVVNELSFLFRLHTDYIYDISIIIQICYFAIINGILITDILLFRTSTDWPLSHQRSSVDKPQLTSVWYIFFAWWEIITSFMRLELQHPSKNWIKIWWKGDHIYWINKYFTKNKGMLYS